MSFTTETWRQKAADQFKRFPHWLKKGEAPFIAYGTVAGLTLWPLVEAAANAPTTEQLSLSLILALGGVAGGVGGNLIAEQLQRWHDDAQSPDEDEIIRWARQQAEQEPHIRQSLDDILEAFDAIPQAQAGLSDTDRAWFNQTLQTELKALGNLPRFTAVFTQTVDSGAIALGDAAVAVGERGVNIGGDVHGHVVTGDENRIVGTNQYIENYHEADPAATVDIHTLRSQYLRRLLAAANALSLTGIDPKAVSDTRDTRLNLGAVYTALLTTRVESLGKTAAGIMPGRSAESRQTAALAQLNQHQHLVLLGNPGSGKSTFVNFMTLCLAGECLQREDVNLQTLTAPLPNERGEDREERQSWDHNALLPLPVVLRDLAARGLPQPGQTVTADHLWHFLEAENKTQSFVPYLRQELDAKGGLILLDGLDEVPEAQQRRTQIKQLVEDLAATLPRARILVTSRTYAYQKQDWQLDGFHEAALAPFSAGQIRRFVDRWYAHIAAQRGLHETDAQGRAQLLKRAIFGSGRLRELAERPLLLTLMASLHAWRGGSLPQKREELYADTVDLLLDWWESQRILRDENGQIINIYPSLAEWLKIDRDNVRNLLHELAFKAHSSQPDTIGTADIPESDLVAGLLHLSEDPDVKPARLIEFLSQRVGLIVPRGVQVYTFPHRTFQEYLAACYLTDNDYPEQIAALARDDPNRWREVALLAGAKAARGSASTIWSLAEALCYQAVSDAGANDPDLWGAHLAAQALTEAANLQKVSPRNEVKAARVKEWLLHIMISRHLPATERAAAAANLAVLGDPRPEVMTVDGMQFCFVPQGEFWMGSDEDNEFDKDAERPLHKVDINYDYWLGRYPITNAQFQTFVDDGGYKEAGYWTEAKAHGFWKDNQAGGYTWLREKQEYEEQWRDRPYDYGRPFNLPNHPVVGLNWYEMLAFTRWLTARWQTADWLPAGWAIQLPSEAEWEKGARGGLTIPTQPSLSGVNAWRQHDDVTMRQNRLSPRRFPWGDDPAAAERANYEETEIDGSSGVGCFPTGRSPYGCEEMAGNVFEWTRSLWGRYDREQSEKADEILFDPQYTYPYKMDDGREKLNKDDWWARVLRGGVWAGGETWLRCADRLRFYPHFWNVNLGFRVCVRPHFSPLASDASDL
ncbi:MAG: SUMF1/EgtB/PvdO family nonheme iron enzyme [Chloroflexi bacterium]|nr:SUMF1/EgtB/PvdO family nonheme iron enzyme [Chloroflexota bacterium]